MQAGNRRQFQTRHAERAITYQANNPLARTRESRANRRWQRVTQPAVRTWNNDGASSTSRAKLRRRKRCHRARIGDNHHIVGRMLPECIDNTLRSERNVVAGSAFGG